GSSVTGTGEEGDALSVALLEEAGGGLEGAGEVLATVIGSGVVELAQAEGGADDIDQVLVDELSIAGDDVFIAQVGQVIENFFCARGGAERHLGVERCLEGIVTVGVEVAAAAFHRMNGDGGNRHLGVLRIGLNELQTAAEVEGGVKGGGEVRGIDD